MDPYLQEKKIQIHLNLILLGFLNFKIKAFLSPYELNLPILNISSSSLSNEYPILDSSTCNKKELPLCSI